MFDYVFFLLQKAVGASGCLCWYSTHTGEAVCIGPQPRAKFEVGTTLILELSELAANTTEIDEKTFFEKLSFNFSLLVRNWQLLILLLIMDFFFHFSRIK